VLELGQRDGGGTVEQGGEHGAAARGEAEAAGAELRDERGVRERRGRVGSRGRGAPGDRGQGEAERGRRVSCRWGRCAEGAERCRGHVKADSGWAWGFDAQEYGGRCGDCLSGAA
jgi:hypothetical protein